MTAVKLATELWQQFQVKTSRASVQRALINGLPCKKTIIAVERNVSANASWPSVFETDLQRAARRLRACLPLNKIAGRFPLCQRA